MSQLRTLIRRIIIILKHFFQTKVYGMHIHPTALISLKAQLDKTNPKGIYVGKKTVITGGVVVLTHNYVMGNGTFVDTKIGDNVFIGTGSIIMPGLTIGNNIIIGAGWLVIRQNLSEKTQILGSMGSSLFVFAQSDCLRLMTTLAVYSEQS